MINDQIKKYIVKSFDNIPTEIKGSYLLFLNCPSKTKIQVGKLGNILFSPGYYIYVGSAMGGIKKRLKAHLKIEKRAHFHLDYLLPHFSIIGFIAFGNQFREECILASKIASFGEAVNGFGSTDCKCISHLFFFGKKRDILNSRPWISLLDATSIFVAL